MSSSQTFPGEVFDDQLSLKRSLLPLLQIMKFAGLYFIRETECRGVVELSEGGRANSRSCGILTRVAATGLLVLSWMNVLRCPTVFSQHDTFDVLLITKLSIWTIFILCAILQTSYFAASLSGHLDYILKEVRVTSEFSNSIRKLALLGIAFASSECLAFTIMEFYVMFASNGFYDFLLTPLTTYVPIDGFLLTTARIIYVLAVQMPCIVTWLLAHVMNHMLAAIFRGQFNLINKRFRQCISHTGQFHGDIRNFRHRHQALCSAVKMSDKFLKFSNVASFGCQMFAVLIVFYASIFTRFTDPLLTFMTITFVSANAVGLAVTTLHGIMVNHAVSVIL